MHKKIFIKTFGCQMNEYDSAKIVDILAAAHGFNVTENIAAADLIIFNTCAVRAKADDKFFSELGRVRLLKKKNPNLIVAVGGCVAMVEQKKIFSRAPFVNIVFGPQTIHRLPQLYTAALNNQRKLIDISTPKIEKFDYFPVPHVAPPAAYISIIEGCNKFCSYCIVPFTRGREISRPMADVMLEVNNLVTLGVKEIHLLGQNVNAYFDSVASYELGDLILAIAAIPAVQRIRFTTSHPQEFTDKLVAVYAREPKLVSHLHLPIQSGSNRVLKLMRRDYTREDYLTLIAKLRQARPGISISSDFIVGFPGETAEDFAETMSIIREVNFDAAYSFIYSPRPNTQAAKLVDDVPMVTKKQRLFALQSQLMVQAQKYNRAMLGTIQKVLVVGNSKKKSQQFTGRMENNRIVNFTAARNVFGAIVKVKITEVLANSLRGEEVSYE